MSSNSTQDIRRLVSSFELFINIYENCQQFSKAPSNEQIKNCFKLAHFLEQTVAHLIANNSIDKWMNILQRSFTEKNKHFETYTIDFCGNACDRLLEKFFSSKRVDITVIDVCVRMYTTLLPMNRFKIFLSNLLNAAVSYNSLLEFISTNKGSEQTLKQLEYRLALNNWSREIQMGRTEKFITAVDEMLKFSQVEKSLHIIIGMLSLEISYQEEHIIKDLLLQTILKKMLDRSVLSKNFWITLIRSNSNDIMKICDYSEKFLQSICNFCIYSGSMMELGHIDGKEAWISNPSISICPEFTYNDLLSLLKCLTNKNFGQREQTIRKIKEAEVNTGSILWTQVIHDLQII